MPQGNRAPRSEETIAKLRKEELPLDQRFEIKLDSKRADWLREQSAITGEPIGVIVRGLIDKEMKKGKKKNNSG